MIEADHARAVEDRYRILFGTIDEGFGFMELVYDAEHRLTDLVFREVNVAFERLTGLRDVVGRTVRDVLPNFEKDWIDAYTRVAQTGVPERYESYAQDVARWYRVHQSRVGGPGSHLAAIVFEDISDRKRAELALRASQERQTFLLSLSDALRAQSTPYSVAAECTRLVAAHMGVDRCYVSRVSRKANLAWLGPEYHRADLGPMSREYRYSDAPDFIRRAETEALFIRDVASEPKLSALDKTSIAGMGMAALIVAPIQRGDRDTIWSLGVGSAAPRMWAEDELHLLEEVADRAWVAIERVRAETELYRSFEHVERLVAERTDERDALRRQLNEAEESERRRLARELHDQLGQDLTAIRLGLDVAARLAAPHVSPDGPVMDRLSQLAMLAGRVTAGVRYLALELRPPELDDVGLASALETYVLEWSNRYGIPAESEVGAMPVEPAIPGNVASAVYRIAQEALTNVAKHAHATQVSVILEHRDGEARLIIEDDGVGFDVGATIARAKADRRLGVAGMQERAILVGGRLLIESEPDGNGTTLYARLPTGLGSGAA